MSDAGLLERKVGHPSPARNDLARWRVIVGLALAPIAFPAQIIVSYVLAALGCSTGAGPAPLLIAVNLVIFGVLVFALLLSWSNARVVRSEHQGVRNLHESGDGRTAFLVHFGFSMSLMFAIASLIEVISVLFLRSCVGFAPSL